MHNSGELHNPVQPEIGQVNPASLRRCTRYKVSLDVRVFINTSAGTEYLYGHGRDISEGGMAVYVPNEFQIGDIATLELTLPYSQEKLLMRAIIRNREGFRYGIEFLYPTEREREIISNSCRELSTLE